MTDDRSQNTDDRCISNAEVGMRKSERRSGQCDEDRGRKTDDRGFRMRIEKSEGIRAQRLSIADLGPPWRDGFDKWHQNGTLEELQPLETILINQVWGRDCGLRIEKVTGKRSKKRKQLPRNNTEIH